MPIPERVRKPEPELKREEQSRRPQLPRHLDLATEPGYRFSIVRFIVLTLAVYGLYSLLS